MLGKRIINTATDAGAACTTDTVQILDGVPFQSIATYELDGNADDLTTNYNGTASNVTYATGKFGNAAVFNGSSSYITLGKLDTALGGLFAQKATFSVSLWFNTSQTTSATKPLFADWNTGSDFNLILEFDTSNNLQVYTGYNSSFIQHTESGLNDGNWHHIAVTVNQTSGFRNIWIDGTQVETNATLPSGAYGAANNSLYEVVIGALFNNSTPYDADFAGKIDQVRIYNKAISAANVATLYAETVATASTNPTFNMPSGVAYYKMNDATDETGSYDGTATNVNFNVAGKFGNAGEFNGSNSVVYSSNTTEVFNNTTKQGTISFWVKFDTLSSTQNIANRWDSGGATTEESWGLWYITGSDYLQFTHRDSSNNNTAAFSNTGLFSTNVWHNVSVVWNGANISFYVNGSFVNTVTNTNFNDALKTTNARLTLGATLRNNNNSTQENFDGSLDQVRIFDRAITATEVETLYNEVQCIPTIVPTDHFEPVIYTGNGGTQPISTLDFEPDFTWIKSRTTGDGHLLFDSVRGATKYLFIQTNAEGTAVNSLTSFDPNGFTLGSDTGSGYNGNGYSFVSWNWKAGGAAVSNTDGTITSQVSANVDAGFSIVKYNLSSPSASDTIGHGLGVAPSLIITKGTSGVIEWFTYHKDVGTGKYLKLEDTAAAVSYANGFSTVNDTVWQEYFTAQPFEKIAYCFHSVDGYSKIGSYTGTGVSGNSIVTGFRPAFVMIKETTTSNNSWCIFDNKRSSSNPIDDILFPNSSGAESVNNANVFLNFNANGFTIGNAFQITNESGKNYIFMAFAEEVFVPEIPFEGGDFNGLEYQLVTNPTTGRTWLDRNLGATRVATSSTDSAAFGYYYQWGRLSDGHQIPTSSTTSTLSGSDVPGNSNFITSTVSPKDWRSPQNSSLWQGPQAYNNPCPPGFRLPTEAEILEEAASWGSQNSAGAFASNLKLPTGSGIRIETGGAPVDTGAGYIWTSTISGTDAKFYYVASGGDFTSNYRRAAGCPVRPIKDE